MEPIINLRHVRVLRDGRAILDTLNLQVFPGEHVCILGPNGSGKSTLLKLMCREIYPHGGCGEVAILGKTRWLQRDLRKVVASVHFLDPETLLGRPTVDEMVLSGLFGSIGVLWGYEVTPRIRAQATRAMELLGIHHLSAREFATLSSGEQRRVLIARATAHAPRVLVLDEPTASLDLTASLELRASLRRLAESGVTLILVTHHLDEVDPIYRKLLLLKEGRTVAQGTRDEVLQVASLAYLFGVDEAKLRVELETKAQSLSQLLSLG